MSLYQLKVNNALMQNPNVAEIDITTHGSDWLWAVFSIMASAFVGEQRSPQ
jgi:bacteriorhodopsin